MSSELGNAAAGRGAGAEVKEAIPLPLHSSLPRPWEHSTGTQRGTRKDWCKVSSPHPWGMGALRTAWMVWGQQLRPTAPPPAASSFSGAQARGCIPVLRWDGQERQLASFPGDVWWPGPCHRSGWKEEFLAARSQGWVPAHSTPAPVSCRRCLVCGLVPAHTMSVAGDWALSAGFNPWWQPQGQQDGVCPGMGSFTGMFQGRRVQLPGEASSPGCCCGHEPSHTRLISFLLPRIRLLRSREPHQ